MKDRYADLACLTGMIYRHRQADLQALRAEEQRVATAMAALKDNRRATAQADHTDPVRQSLGADILWQGWLDARLRELNIEMARLRARREPVEQRLRVAFGRDQVANAMQKDAAQAEHARRKKRHQD
jgi:carbohydrate-selective porin OprB